MLRSQEYVIDNDLIFIIENFKNSHGKDSVLDPWVIQSPIIYSCTVELQLSNIQLVWVLDK